MLVPVAPEPDSLRQDKVAYWVPVAPEPKPNDSLRQDKVDDPLRQDTVVYAGFGGSEARPPSPGTVALVGLGGSEAKRNGPRPQDTPHSLVIAPVIAGPIRPLTEQKPSMNCAIA